MAPSRRFARWAPGSTQTNENPPAALGDGGEPRRVWHPTGGAHQVERLARLVPIGDGGDALENWGTLRRKVRNPSGGSWPREAGTGGTERFRGRRGKGSRAKIAPTPKGQGAPFPRGFHGATVPGWSHPMTPVRALIALALASFALMPVASGSPDAPPREERRGCCSHHRGVCGCEGGRTQCCDGTASPTCRCD